jgi:hypothetical protein
MMILVDVLMIKDIAFLPFLNILSSRVSTLTCFMQIKIALRKITPQKAFLNQV